MRSKSLHHLTTFLYVLLFGVLFFQVRAFAEVDPDPGVPPPCPDQTYKKCPAPPGCTRSATVSSYQCLTVAPGVCCLYAVTNWNIECPGGGSYCQAKKFINRYTNGSQCVPTVPGDPSSDRTCTGSSPGPIGPVG